MMGAFLRFIGAAFGWLWDVVLTVGEVISFVAVQGFNHVPWNSVGAGLQRGYRWADQRRARWWRTVRILGWACVGWLALSWVLWLLNVYAFHSRALSSVIGLTSLFIAVVLAFFAGRILFLVAVVKGLINPRLWRWRASDLEGVAADMQRGRNPVQVLGWDIIDSYAIGLRWLSWLAIVELLFFVYGNIFPMWNNYGVIPLFLSAVLVLVLLNKKLDRESDRDQYWEQVRRVMLVIAVLCSMSFLAPGPFQRFGAMLTSLQTKAASDTWFPVSALLIVFITIAVYGSKSLLKYTQWLMIGLASSYIGYVAISAVWIKHNTPLVPTVFLGTVALVLVLAAIGLTMPKSTDTSGKRMALGVGLAGLTCACLLLFYGGSQDGQYVDPVTGAAKVFVATDPVTETQIGVRGPKAATYTVDPEYGQPFVAWTSLTREEQDKFGKNPKWIDEVELEGLGLMNSNATYTLKGGTP